MGGWVFSVEVGLREGGRLAIGRVRIGLLLGSVGRVGQDHGGSGSIEVPRNGDLKQCAKRNDETHEKGPSQLTLVWVV